MIAAIILADDLAQGIPHHVVGAGIALAAGAVVAILVITALFK